LSTFWILNRNKSRFATLLVNQSVVLKKLCLKGLSHELDLAFDDGYGY
jgi:hypothetical protein